MLNVLYNDCMSAVKSIIFSILFLSLFISVFSASVEASYFEIDVYGVDTSPHTVDEGDDVTISGYVKLENATSGSHTVTVKWYVNGNLKQTKDYSMSENEEKRVEWDFDTSGLSKGTHDVKIEATVDSFSDYDTDHFYLEEEEIEISVDDLEVYPDTICVYEEEVIELSIRVRLEKGPDNTPVEARFYIREYDYWDYIGNDKENLDRDERETFVIDAYYDGFELEEGTIDVKVVVEAGDQKETEYSTLRVKECYPDVEYDIEVGFISLNPQYPEFGEDIYAKVPITLQSAPDLPQDVRLRVFIDGVSTYSSTLWFYHLEKKTYSFNIHTLDYYPGTHTIDVTATVGGTSDSSGRTFNVGPGQMAGIDCLSVDEIWTDEPLKPGESAVIHVSISNCGSITEYNIKTSLTAFSKTYFSDIYSISPGMNREIQFITQVPEDILGVTTFGVRVYNSYTSDSMAKDFTIYTGAPSIRLKPQYDVKECEINEFSFQIINEGDVSDTFFLNVEGEASEWMTGIPEKITLGPNEKKTINVFVNIPCDLYAGEYQFTVIASNFEEYYASSKLNVIKGLEWPTFPTGFVGFTGSLLWLPWILLLVLIIILYIIYLEYIKERKRPMF